MGDTTTVAYDKDGNLGMAEREKWARACGDKAMEWLREAIRKGFKDAARLKSEPQLAALRGRDDFRELVARLEQPAPPPR